MFNSYHKVIFVNVHITSALSSPPNGLRYLRWGGDGEAVKPDKTHSVDKT